jgi:hypothetical protein
VQDPQSHLLYHKKKKKKEGGGGEGRRRRRRGRRRRRERKRKKEEEEEEEGRRKEGKEGGREMSEAECYEASQLQAFSFNKIPSEKAYFQLAYVVWEEENALCLGSQASRGEFLEGSFSAHPCCAQC